MTDAWEHDPLEVADKLDETADGLAEAGSYDLPPTLHNAAQMLRDLWERDAERDHQPALGKQETLEELAVLHELAHGNLPGGGARSDFADGVEAIRRYIEQVQPVDAERDQLRAENEKLWGWWKSAEENAGRLQRKWNKFEVVHGFVDEATAIAQETGQYDDWITHDSYNAPADLAAAQLVVLDWDSSMYRWEVRGVYWYPGLRYRPALSESGLPLCSAEGLEPWARWVITSSAGVALQCANQPTWTGKDAGAPGVASSAPLTHRRPGPASESLMEVDR